MAESESVKKRTRSVPKCSICGSTSHDLRTCQKPEAFDVRLKKKKQKSKHLNHGIFEQFGTQVTVAIMENLDALSLIKLGRVFNGLQSLISSVMCIRIGCSCKNALNVAEKRYNGCFCGESTFQNLYKNIRSGYSCIECGKDCRSNHSSTRKRMPPSKYIQAKYFDKLKNKFKSGWRYFRMHQHCEPNFVSDQICISILLQNISTANFDAPYALSNSFRMLLDISAFICVKYRSSFIIDDVMLLKENGTDIGYEILNGPKYVSKEFFHRVIRPDVETALVSVIEVIKKYS